MNERFAHELLAGDEFAPLEPRFDERIELTAFIRDSCAAARVNRGAVGRGGQGDYRQRERK
jgi:hypothetical protein